MLHPGYTHFFREQLFNTGRGGLENSASDLNKIYNPSVAYAEKDPTPLKHIKDIPPSPSSYFIYTQIQMFFLKTALL